MGVWSQKQDIAFFFSRFNWEREKNITVLLALGMLQVRHRVSEFRRHGPGGSSAASLSGALPLKWRHSWENYLYVELTFAVWLYWFGPLVRPVRIPQLRSSQWLNLHVGAEDLHPPSWFCRFRPEVWQWHQHEKPSTSALSLQIQRRASPRNSSLPVWSMEGIWS